MRLKTHRGTQLALGLLLVATTVNPAVAGVGNQIKSFFLNTGVQTQARGKLHFVTNPAQSFFSISVSNMAPGTYDVALDGAVVDTLSVNSHGKGTLLHRSQLRPKRGAISPLPYDPRGGQVSIELAGTMLLEAEVPETPEEGTQKVEIESELANLGVVSGEAKAEFEELFGRMQFEVELEDAPTGTYDLLVDSVIVGQIHVGIDGEGRIQFDSVPAGGDDEDDQGEGLDLLLTFDPRGKSIEISQEGVADFSGVFPLQGPGDDGDDDNNDQD